MLTTESLSPHHVCITFEWTEMRTYVSQKSQQLNNTILLKLLK